PAGPARPRDMYASRSRRSRMPGPRERGRIGLQPARVRPRPRSCGGRGRRRRACAEPTACMQIQTRIERSVLAVPELGQVLWEPPADVRERSVAGRFLTWLERNRGLSFAGYDELHRWSIHDLEGFWSAIWDFFEIR